MVNATVQVERDAAHIEIVTLLVQKFLAGDVVHQAIARQRGRDNVKVMIQRMGLKGCASRISARPDDQFSALIRESLPDFREIDIETDRQAQLAKISLKHSHLVARLDRWLQLELAP